uniref:Carbonic anhydrase n=2 Tax=Caenorhabditis japonica TaxID=281687 RepID=A0A8R1EGB3_CAEJA
MFVVRNSGNMIPHANNYGPSGYEVSVTTEPAALELAVKRGKINHVIVCGHSDCKIAHVELVFLWPSPEPIGPEIQARHIVCLFQTNASMSRPGAWSRVGSNLWKYLKGDVSKKHYVAEDAAGNRFYEISNSRQNVSRGFDSPTSGAQIEPDIEWQAWLRGTRRFPPSDQEISFNRMKQQVSRFFLKFL